MAELKDYLLDDYKDVDNYLARLHRGGLSAFPPLIISCAITGANHGKESNMNLPESPAEQAEQTYDAYKAGTSIVHVHRRSSKNQAIMSNDPEEYREINAMIREKCPDIIINNTAACGRIRTVSGSDRFSGSERPYSDGEISAPLLTSIYASPEMASIDISNYVARTKLRKREPPLTGRDEDVLSEISFSITPTEVENAIKLMKEYGVKPEFELFDIGDLVYLHQLIKAGLVEGPHLVQMVFHEMTNFATADYLMTTIRCTPKNSILSVIGVGPCQFPIITMAMIQGCHVRVGMEDNIYIERGKLAESNAQFVEKVVRIAKELGRPVATPTQAREMLDLGVPRDFKYKK
jgi:3-keto-5-aminohexanoate cleavage enzyme